MDKPEDTWLYKAPAIEKASWEKNK